MDVPIHQSAHKGDFDLTRQKLEEDPTLLNQLDSCERLPIHWACLGGNVKLVTHLIVELNCPVDPLDETETTPLILASSAGHVEIVDLLLKKNVNVNQRSTFGHSALQYAASKGWVKICEKLLEKGADINIRDGRNSTPLHRAASKGNTQIVQLFLVHLDQLNINAKDQDGNTSLHLACEEDRQTEALLLVEKGADVSIVNRQKLSPLDVSSASLTQLIKNKINSGIE